MERYFILDNHNTWYEWDLIHTGKVITPPEPKTNYVQIDGMSGTLDLTESLTGEVTYNDRTITASFWTDKGNRKDRERLLREIVRVLHGKKMKITEPDDLDHYFMGRVKITAQSNNVAFCEFTIEATCEPWRYANDNTERNLTVNSRNVTDMILHNNGVKTLCPEISIVGNVDIIHEGTRYSLSSGDYKISDIKLRQGVNILGVSGTGAVTVRYKEATL